MPTRVTYLKYDPNSPERPTQWGKEAEPAVTFAYQRRNGQDLYRDRTGTVYIPCPLFARAFLSGYTTVHGSVPTTLVFPVDALQSLSHRRKGHAQRGGDPRERGDAEADGRGLAQW